MDEGGEGQMQELGDEYRGKMGNECRLSFFLLAA